MAIRDVDGMFSSLDPEYYDILMKYVQVLAHIEISMIFLAFHLSGGLESQGIFKFRPLILIYQNLKDESRFKWILKTYSSIKLRNW